MNIAELYSLYENLPADSGEVMVKANCHDDKKASLSINLDTGLWCCHACIDENTGKKLGGDLIDYVRLQQGYEDMKPKQIQAMIAEEADINTEEVMDIIKKAKDKAKKTESKHIEPISESKVDGWHSMLLGDVEALERFKKRRGLSDEIINRYKIGWDGTERYLIPIRDEHGNIVNIRKYNPDVSGGDKMISYTVKYEYDTLGRVIKEKTVKSDTTDEETEIADKIAQGILPEGSTISESEAVGAIVEYTYENEMAGDTIKANKVTKEINLPDNCL